MNLLNEALLLLFAAVLAVPLFRKLGLGAVLGYLAAGVLIGPSCLRLIGDVHAVFDLSEFGVILLLFVIGLELQPSRLWVLRRQVFGLGLAQVGSAGAVFGAVAWYAGLHWQAALITGLGLAMSSTAFALQTLAERNQLASRHGRDSFSILLFQDISVIPLLALIPFLAPGVQVHPSGSWVMAARPVVVLLGVILGGRYLLRPVFRRAARAGNREVFTAAALLVVIGAASLLAWAGLSMSLGAFLAGMLLADSEYRHEIEANIEPFKGLLLGLFFMAVGMSANLGLLYATPWLIIGLAAGLIAVKFGLLYGVARRVSRSRRAALQLGAALAQGGEFAFVLFGLATRSGLLTQPQADALVMAVTLSMFAAPFVFIGVERYASSLPMLRSNRPFDTPEVATPVIIAGFGRFGQIVGRVLLSQKIPFTALEKSPEQVDFVRRFGNKVYYGDASHPELLHAAHAEQARLFVLAIDDVDDSIKTAEALRRHFPDLPVFARARNRFHAYKLLDAGVKVFYRETFSSSLEMSGAILSAMGLTAEQSRRAIDTFRDVDEALLLRQYAIYQDEAQLIATSNQAMAELRSLFEAEAELQGKIGGNSHGSIADDNQAPVR